jgi:hypothetical protein
MRPGFQVKWTHQQLQAWTSANRRAEGLLHGYLSAAQQEEYAQSGVFSVASELGHRYEIARHTIRRFERDSEDGWKPVMSYCLEPAGLDIVPVADIMLARALWLTLNELEFLRTAASRRAEASTPPQDFPSIVGSAAMCRLRFVLIH